MPTGFKKCLYVLLLSMLVSKSSTVFIVEKHTLTPIILGKINMNASNEIVFPFCHSLTKAITEYVFTVGIDH
jgi:hypothetical protein